MASFVLNLRRVTTVIKTAAGRAIAAAADRAMAQSVVMVSTVENLSAAMMASEPTVARNADCSGAGTGALCGDGVLCEDTEMCDDGNTISEACLYGQESCIVCGASCIYEDGETSFCGDGIRNQGPELDDSDFETCDVLEDARPCTSLSPVFADGTSSCRADCRGWDTSGCAVETADLALMVPVEAGPFARLPCGCRPAVLRR